MKIIIDDEVIERYNKYYFVMHPRARKAPIERPIHPTINSWFVLQRQAMNSLKQKHKDFIVWLCKDLGINNMKIHKCKIISTTYMPTKRRVDVDNLTLKFWLDGLVEAGFIEDDCYSCVTELTLRAGYDKDNPRTEIIIEEME